ncbi:MAG: ABC transporter permease [Actinobacteria bacterium]|nr:ABC transporter permease [Actinomycetota bacterium]
MLITVLAFVAALLVGAVIIVLSEEALLAAWGSFLSDPLNAIDASWDAVYGAYSALLAGSIGSPLQIVDAVASGDGARIRSALAPLGETIVAATPLMLAGLGIALGFRAGLFNIGGEGQLLMGGVFAVFVGFGLTGLPAVVHLPLALIAAVVGGGLWGSIPGWLKARTGAHEVITTIMLNQIAIQLTLYLLSTTAFQRPGRSDPVSKMIEPSAQLPGFTGILRLHAGILIALGMVWVVHWLLFRSTLGFRFRAVGLNPEAARTAGIRVGRSTILVLAISGALAGLGGGVQMLGLQRSLTPGFSGGIGFDAITVALLGRSSPIGTMLAALLFGVLKAGSLRMQGATGTAPDLIIVLQALIVLFVAAPALVRATFRLRDRHVAADPAPATGWSV